MVWSGDDDVGYVKMRMYHKTGVRPEDQLLMWWGTLLDDDTRTLQSLNVKDEAIMQMSVKCRGGEIPVNLYWESDEDSEELDDESVESDDEDDDEMGTPEEVVAEYKRSCAEIAAEVQRRVDMHVARVEHLRDVKCRRVMPTSFGYQIFIRLLGGKTLVLFVRSSDRILVVMQQIEAAVGVPPDYQRLIYEGKELERSRTLRDYNIDKGSLLWLLLRLRGGGGGGNEGDDLFDDIFGEGFFDDVLHSADTERSVKRQCLPAMSSTDVPEMEEEAVDVLSNDVIVPGEPFGVVGNLTIYKSPSPVYYGEKEGDSNWDEIEPYVVNASAVSRSAKNFSSLSANDSQDGCEESLRVADT